MKRLQTWFFAWIFPWVPKRLLSRMTGVFMRTPIPGPLRGILVHMFARTFNIGIHEAEFETRDYRSFNDFFTRKLKPGIRPVQGPFVHPVDGALTQHGQIKQGELIQAKDWTYSVAEFIGDSRLAAKYERGNYYTYYLCPADYHRVHAPVEGQLVSARHIPGLLWPVNEWSVNNVRRLFNLNERVVMNFTSPQGNWTLVMVGATNVGQITITLDPSITTNKWMWHAPTDRIYEPPLHVQAGDELGMFHLGSTVICLFESSFQTPSAPNFGAVKMGEKAH